MATNQVVVEKEPETPTQRAGRPGISLRAVLIGIVLVVIVCCIVCYAELVIGRIQIGFLQMPPAAIGIFFFMVLFNTWLRATSKRLGLNPGEMLMTYCMMVVAAMVSSRGVMEKVIPTIVTVNYYANTGNDWRHLFFPHIKKWMVAFDPNGPPQQRVAKQFFEGLREGERIPWRDWIVPLCMWGILVILVLFAFLCLAAILRKQWVDNEKLSFPLVQPATELVQQEGESILKNRMFWGGVGLPCLIFGINGIHNWFPSIPEIQLSIYLNSFITSPPWNQMYWTAIYMSFAAVGFFFLLPSDLLFSVWFFAVLTRLEDVLVASYGMDLPRMRCYGTHQMAAYQTAGAYFVIVGYLMWVALPHLKQVVRSAFGKEKVDDSNELMPFGLALKGLIISFLLIVTWCFMAGMSPWVAILEFGVFIFVVAFVMARSTAEGGMLMTETTFRPVDLYTMIRPAQSLGVGNLTLLALIDTTFLREQRGLLFTGMMDGLKMTDSAGVKRRSYLTVFAVAIVVSFLVAGYLHMWFPYHKGGITLYEAVYHGLNLNPLTDYEAQIRDQVKPTWQAPTFFAVGVVTAAFLAYMRAMFFWWPLHPLGYALSVSWTVSVFWFSALVAWLIKSLILRYGGMQLYAKARPWFLGMVVGEFGSAVIWTLISAATGMPTPTYPWP
jgi:hypothetical protein